ncbi:hypothetical protein HDU97_001328 [Phlyctochytrium planicorne]|nr:hypothetical protein HDU97_001328 [Phlyctochytrium planicorne]
MANAVAALVRKHLHAFLSKPFYLFSTVIAIPFLAFFVAGLVMNPIPPPNPTSSIPKLPLNDDVFENRASLALPSAEKFVAFFFPDRPANAAIMQNFAALNNLAYGSQVRPSASASLCASDIMTINLISLDYFLVVRFPDSGNTSAIANSTLSYTIFLGDTTESTYKSILTTTPPTYNGRLLASHLAMEKAAISYARNRGAGVGLDIKLDLEFFAGVDGAIPVATRNLTTVNSGVNFKIRDGSGVRPYHISLSILAVILPLTLVSAFSGAIGAKIVGAFRADLFRATAFEVLVLLNWSYAFSMAGFGFALGAILKFSNSRKVLLFGGGLLGCLMCFAFIPFIFADVRALTEAWIGISQSGFAKFVFFFICPSFFFVKAYNDVALVSLPTVLNNDTLTPFLFTDLAPTPRLKNMVVPLTSLEYPTAFQKYATVEDTATVFGYLGGVGLFWIAVVCIWMYVEHASKRRGGVERSEGQGVKVVDVSGTGGLGVGVRGLTVEFGPGLNVVYGKRKSGKTALLNILSLSTKPDTGTVHLSNPPPIFIPRNALHPDLSPRQNLEFQMRLNCSGDWKKIFEEVGKRLDSETVLKENTVRAEITVAVARGCPGRTVLVDDCGEGLDGVERRKVWAILQQIRDGRTIVVSSRSTQDVEAIADQVYIMRNGELVTHGLPSILKPALTRGFLLTLTPKSIRGPYNGFRLGDFVAAVKPPMPKSGPIIPSKYPLTFWNPFGGRNLGTGVEATEESIAKAVRDIVGGYLSAVLGSSVFGVGVGDGKCFVIIVGTEQEGGRPAGLDKSLLRLEEEGVSWEMRKGSLEEVLESLLLDQSEMIVPQPNQSPSFVTFDDYVKQRPLIGPFQWRQVIDGSVVVASPGFVTRVGRLRVLSMPLENRSNWSKGMREVWWLIQARRRLGCAQRWLLMGGIAIVLFVTFLILNFFVFPWGYSRQDERCDVEYQSLGEWSCNGVQVMRSRLDTTYANLAPTGLGSIVGPSISSTDASFKTSDGQVSLLSLNVRPDNARGFAIRQALYGSSRRVVTYAQLGGDPIDGIFPKVYFDQSLTDAFKVPLNDNEGTNAPLPVLMDRFVNVGNATARPVWQKFKDTQQALVGKQVALTGACKNLFGDSAAGVQAAGLESLNEAFDDSYPHFGLTVRVLKVKEDGVAFDGTLATYSPNPQRKRLVPIYTNVSGFSNIVSSSANCTGLVVDSPDFSDYSSSFESLRVVTDGILKAVVQLPGSLNTFTSTQITYGGTIQVRKQTPSNDKPSASIRNSILFFFFSCTGFMFPNALKALVHEKRRYVLSYLSARGVSIYSYWYAFYTHSYITMLVASLPFLIVSSLCGWTSRMGFGLYLVLILVWIHVQICFIALLASLVSKRSLANAVGWYWMLGVPTLASFLGGRDINSSSGGDGSLNVGYAVFPPWGVLSAFSIFDTGSNNAAAAAPMLIGLLIASLVGLLGCFLITLRQRMVIPEPRRPLSFNVFKRRPAEIQADNDVELAQSDDSYGLPVGSVSDESNVQGHNLIRVADLSKIVAGRKVLDSVSFSIDSGEIVTVVGSSNDSKTIALELIAGVIEPSSGHIEMDGRPITSAELKQRVGFVPRVDAFWQDLTVLEHFLVYGGMMGIGREETIRRFNEIVGVVGLLPTVKDLKLRLMTGVGRKSVALAVALLGSPAILVLDEPTEGLNANAKSDFWKLLQRVQKAYNFTMVISTNDEENPLSSRIGVLSNGKVKFFKPHRNSYSGHEHAKVRISVPLSYACSTSSTKDASVETSGLLEHQNHRLEDLQQSIQRVLADLDGSTVENTLVNCSLVSSDITLAQKSFPNDELTQFGWLAVVDCEIRGARRRTDVLERLERLFREQGISEWSFYL